MNEFLRICIIVCPLVFLAGFIDSVAGGGGIISIPAYFVAGLPTRLALGTNKLVAFCGTSLSAYKYMKDPVVVTIKNKEVEIILDEIEKLLNIGPAYYDIDEYTDQTSRQLVEEVIREKALKLLDDEVPHGLYVEVEKMKLSRTKMNEKIYNIEATIFCLRDSHKGIIIGKNGSMLKRIGTYARQDLEKMLDMKINLKTWVKVKKDWQDEEAIVKKFKFN